MTGPVYLTGAGETAGHVTGPFGLDVVVPAKAGPFNLGIVVVHAVINIDRSTTAVSITSDPLPQSIDGVPLRIKEVQVRADRQNFMSNPTNCEAGPQHEIAATLTGQPQKDGEAGRGSTPGGPGHRHRLRGAGVQHRRSPHPRTPTRANAPARA